MLYSTPGLIPRKLDGMAFRPTRLKQRREQKGLTQEELGKAIGSGQVQIARYETSKRHPDHMMLAKLADALDTTSDYLLGIIDYPERLTEFHHRIAQAAERGDTNGVIDLMREYLTKKGLGKKPITRKKPPLT
jgi:transcriptional regulator with XRE-family HTH domain